MFRRALTLLLLLALCISARAGVVAGPGIGIGINGNGGAATPTLAATWGLTHRTFHEPCQTSGNFDLSATGNPGYTFFTITALPGASTSPTPSGDVTVGSGTCTIGYQGSGYYSIASAYWTAGTSYVGNAFSPPYYVEVNWTINKSCSNDGVAIWPIIELQSLNGGVLDNPSISYVENDFVENFPNSNDNPSNDANKFYWTCTGVPRVDGSTCTKTANTTINWATVPTGAQTYGVAVLPTTYSFNGNTGGVAQHSYNGTYVSGMNLTFAATGNYSTLNTDPAVIWISGGEDSCLATFGYVDVWQAP